MLVFCGYAMLTPPIIAPALLPAAIYVDYSWRSKYNTEYCVVYVCRCTAPLISSFPDYCCSSSQNIFLESSPSQEERKMGDHKYSPITTACLKPISRTVPDIQGIINLVKLNSRLNTYCINF